jgi:hypothetical protein
MLMFHVPDSNLELMGSMQRRLSVARKILWLVLVFGGCWLGYYLSKLALGIFDPCRTYARVWLNWFDIFGDTLILIYYTLCPLTMIYINPELGTLCKRLLVDNIVAVVKCSA